MAPYVNFRGSPVERLLALCIPEPNSGCWLWLGYCNSEGYGGFRLDRRNETAHRASWMLFCGPIPDAMEIDHRCRNRCCVNPEHLRIVTKAINLAHRTKERAVCWRGHRLAGENLALEPSGIRRCRQCRAASRLKYETGKRHHA